MAPARSASDFVPVLERALSVREATLPEVASTSEGGRDCGCAGEEDGASARPPLSSIKAPSTPQQLLMQTRRATLALQDFASREAAVGILL